MSPLEIKMLLHFYTTPSKYEGSEYKSDAWYAAIRRFEEDNLIEPYDGNPPAELTDRGRAYVEMLVAVPLPKKRCQWVDDYGEVVRQVDDDSTN